MMIDWHHDLVSVQASVGSQVSSEMSDDQRESLNQEANLFFHQAARYRVDDVMAIHQLRKQIKAYDSLQAPPPVPPKVRYTADQLRRKKTPVVPTAAPQVSLVESSLDHVGNDGGSGCIGGTGCW